VNFEDKLLDGLIKEPIRKIPQIASQSFDEKICQHGEFRTPVLYGSGVRKGPLYFLTDPVHSFPLQNTIFIYSCILALILVDFSSQL
jgi:hypothetical protein